MKEIQIYNQVDRSMVYIEVEPIRFHFSHKWLLFLMVIRRFFFPLSKVNEHYHSKFLCCLVVWSLVRRHLFLNYIIITEGSGKTWISLSQSLSATSAGFLICLSPLINRWDTTSDLVCIKTWSIVVDHQTHRSDPGIQLLCKTGKLTTYIQLLYIALTSMWVSKI